MKTVIHWCSVFSLLMLGWIATIPQMVWAQQPAITIPGQMARAERTAIDPYKSGFFRVSGKPDLHVHSISGDITVKENSTLGGVQIDLYVEQRFSLWSGSRNLDNYRIIMQQQGNKVIASVEDRRTGGRPGNNGDVRFHFVIQVPEETSTELRTIRGDIRLENISGEHFLQNHAGKLAITGAEGIIRAASTSGDIDLDGLAGEIYAKTVSGNIRIDENRGEIRARSISGHISAAGISGTLISATTSGNITTDFKQVVEGIYLETVSGDIRLSVPPATGYEIHGEGMRFDLAGLRPSSISEQTQNFRERRIVIGDGGLPIRVSTLSGLIQVSESQ